VQACVETASRTTEGSVNFPLRVSTESGAVEAVTVVGCVCGALRTLPLPTLRLPPPPLQIELAPAAPAAAGGAGGEEDGADGGGGEPLRLEESDFVPERVVRLLPKLHWPALRKTASEVRSAERACAPPVGTLCVVRSPCQVRGWASNARICLF
jgi:hypothetical protein